MARTLPDGKQLSAAGAEEFETADILVHKILHVSRKAFKIVAGGRLYWLPKSVVVNPENYSRAHWNQRIEVYLWWAEQAGLV